MFADYVLGICIMCIQLFMYIVYSLREACVFNWLLYIPLYLIITYIKITGPIEMQKDLTLRRDIYQRFYK